MPVICDISRKSLSSLPRLLVSARSARRKWQPPVKIVDRKTFIELPSGTMFARLQEPWVFEEPSIKGDTIEGNDDFWLIPFTGPEDFGPSYERMAFFGESLPINTIVQREALYDDDSRYLVYEESDIELLLALLGRPRLDGVKTELTHWRYRVGALEREVAWNRNCLERLAMQINDIRVNPPEDVHAGQLTEGNLVFDATQMDEAINYNLWLLEEARWNVEGLMVQILGDRYGI
jgi:hypothetical protein